ncbi:MAG: hypothetical protein KDB00_24085 [Planctomycetales bacterium]|nr:hypothetical protein [Planctomycetales bacterium]
MTDAIQTDNACFGLWHRASLEWAFLLSIVFAQGTMGVSLSAAENHEERDPASVVNQTSIEATAADTVFDRVEPIMSKPGRIPFVYGVAFDGSTLVTPDNVNPDNVNLNTVTTGTRLALQSEELPSPDATLRRELRPTANGPAIEELQPPALQPTELPRPAMQHPPLQSAQDILDLENVTVQPALIESGATPNPAATAAWLDIRPRGIDDAANLISRDQLPTDTSELQPQDSMPRLIQLYRADLLMRDIWPGASFCHHPLYFEDQRLERCGTIGMALHHCPSLHSGAHFIWKAGTLPLSMAITPPCQCVRSGCKPTGIMARFR